MGKRETADQIQRSFIGHKNIDLYGFTVLRGPNRWTYRPVLEALVDIGELEDFPSNTLHGFPQRLRAWLPSLVEHRCSYGETGGFLRRVDEGTWPAHILEHVTLELQNLAGLPGGFGRARETSQRGVYTVAVSAFEEHITELALRRARDLVLAAIADETFDVGGTVAELRERVAQSKLSPITFGIIKAAEKRGVPCQRLVNCDLLQLGFGAKQQRLRLGETERTSAIADGIARDYRLSKQLLASCGLPVLEGQTVETAEQARAAQADFGPAVRVRTRTHAAATTSDPARLHALFTSLAATDEEVIVEQDIQGETFHLLLVGGRLVWASAQAAGTPEVGSGLDLSTRVHPSFTNAAALAARVIGLNIAMVEVVAQSLLLPLRQQRAAIAGITTGAQTFTKVTAAPLIERISSALLDHLFNVDEDGRIPVVGITGTTGTTATTRLLAQLIGRSGKRIGVSSKDGVFLDRRRLPEPLDTGWHAAQQVLANRTVETAIIENDLYAIAETGLAYDRCAVGVVLDLDPQVKIAARGIDNAEQLYAVLRTQVDVVLRSGIAILNATDANVLKMAALSDGEVMLFAAGGLTPALRDHLNAGGRAVYFRDDTIVLATAADEQLLLSRDLDLKPGAATRARSSDGTSIAGAVAAAWALGTPLELLQIGLDAYAENRKASIVTTA